MKRIILGSLALYLFAMISAYTPVEDNSEVVKYTSNILESEEVQEVMEESLKVTIQVANQGFTATLFDNPTTRALIEKLPMTIQMDELNGNEKYYYMPDQLPTSSERVGYINKGDIMLYGKDCLVLFYESFSSSYSYTKLGYIEDPEYLDSVLRDGSIAVTFLKYKSN